ncbi:hypothetical protein E8K88_02720 [Lampropedia aestuarii]|uniref:Uncharacterized protein n=1 Tax=Lampropedia aestuarii TaxID=2562762 RepID=A0A4S5BTG2_9BURK|nr:hypothetical protein [Lampropedia aestuarii]THJ36194.1 hypothetical protein E8K88_02720 [Lampropedia aestuarii]
MDEENTQSASTKKGINSLSDDEFQRFISTGKTMNIKQINARLGGPFVTAGLIETLRIESRKERAATHIAADHFHKLAARLAAHILTQSGRSTEEA